MEFTNLNQENLVNISFTDVMQVIASEETCHNDKMVYIYLLNVIMDMGERTDELSVKVNTIENTKDENKYED